MFRHRFRLYCIGAISNLAQAQNGNGTTQLDKSARKAQLDKSARKAPDGLRRDSTAQRPDVCCCGDLTEISPVA